MVDQYRTFRELPLVGVLRALGVTTEWKSRKGGTEWSGPCPVCKPKKNRGNFSFAADGKWRCFSSPAKGRGAIDLTMAVARCGFQEAVSVLGGLPTVVAPSENPLTPSTRELGLQPSTLENPPFKSSYGKFFKSHAWLTARGLTDEVLARYGVGF